MEKWIKEGKIGTREEGKWIKRSREQSRRRGESDKVRESEGEWGEERGKEGEKGKEEEEEEGEEGEEGGRHAKYYNGREGLKWGDYGGVCLVE